jgi:hypothetical protein
MSADPAHSSPIPATCPPFDWPCREDGLFMNHLGRVLVVRIEEQISPRAFDKHLAELGRALDLRADDQRNAVIYDVPWLSSMDALRRRNVAETLNQRKDILRRSTAAFALVTASKLVRGAMEAIFWMSPPSFPVLVGETCFEAFGFVQRFLPEVDPASYDREYQRQIGRPISGARRVWR